MTRLTRDELVDLMDQCGGALLEEQAAHAQTRAALAAAEAKVEAVGELLGKWARADVLTVGKSHVIANSGVVKGAVDLLSAEICTALASPGPSLRERVENAVAAIQGRASGDYNAERAYSYGVAAGLVQAALNGDS